MATSSEKPDGHTPADLWGELTRPGKPHPCWWHPLNLTSTTAFVGIGLDAVDLTTPQLAIGTGAAALASSGVFAASVDAADRLTARYQLAAGGLGATSALGAGCWAWLAEHTGLLENLAQTGPWISLGVGGGLFAAAYSTLRLRLAAARNPQSRLAREFRQREHGSTWQKIMYRAGFGHCEITGHEETWSGYTVWIQLDDDRNDTAQAVVAAQAKITGIAARIIGKDEGTKISGDAIRIQETEDALTVMATVRMAQVLTNVVDPFDGHEATAETIERIGRFEDGDPIAMPQAGPHGVAVGASGSGKTTYENSMVAEDSRRVHVANWVAGISKFYGFVGRWMAPVAEGLAERPVFDMVGGGDEGQDEQFRSALNVLVAAHTLMRIRMATPPHILARTDGDIVPSAEHPLVRLHMDEIDAMIKYKGEDGKAYKVTLPGGQIKTVAQMLTDIGSKGRSEGIDLELGAQKLTDDFLGMAVSSLLTNVSRRAAFRTDSGHDASKLLGGQRLDPRKLRNYSMYLALSNEAAMAPGKATFHDADSIAAYTVAANANDTLTSLGDYEAEQLGALYTARWSRARVGSLLTYMGGRIDHLARTAPAATVATAPAAPAAEAASSTGRRTGEETQPRRGSGDASGDLRRKREEIMRRMREQHPQQPEFTEPAESESDEVPQPSQASTGQDPSGFLDDFAAIRNLPEISDEQRHGNRRPEPHPVPEPLATLVEAYADESQKFVSTRDLAIRIGRVDAEDYPMTISRETQKLGRELVSEPICVPKRFERREEYGGEKIRGFLLADLRAAAEQLAAGETRTPPTEE